MFERYPEYEYLFAQVQLVLFMLGTGATLSTADFLRILRQPKYLFVGAVGQFVLTPLLALLLSHWFQVQDGIAIGLILVAAMPGGTLSKVFTYLGKGNIALSITLTAAGTVASLATVPLLLQVLATEYVPSDFVMPIGSMVRDLVLYLLLPLGIGMLVSRHAHDSRLAFSRWCIRAGFVVVVLMIVGALGSGRIRPDEYGWQVPLVIILFCILAQQLSMLPFRLLGWPKPDCLSVGIEVTMRNLNLALLLKALLFPTVSPLADGVLFVILYYAGVAFFAGVPLALNFRRMANAAKRREAAQGNV